MNINNLTKKELIKLAKNLNIKKYSRYNKYGLKNYIINHNNYKKYLISKKKPIKLPIDIIDIILDYRVGLEVFIGETKNEMGEFKLMLDDMESDIIDGIMCDTMENVNHYNDIDGLFNGNALLYGNINYYINSIGSDGILNDTIEEMGGILWLLREWEHDNGEALDIFDINKDDTDLKKILLYNGIKNKLVDENDLEYFYELLQILIDCGEKI